MDIKSIIDSWKVDEPKFDELGKVVSTFLKTTITECEILPEISYRTKDLLSIVKKIKKKKRVKEYSYNHLNDKLGLRIICTFQEDMDKIDIYLHKYFNIINVEKKREILDVKSLDYLSNHYDACIDTKVKQFSNYSYLKELVFEVQVRTLNQHAWANTAHSLSYKQEAEIPPILMRKVYRLLSLFEIADDEFSLVNKALVEQPGNLVYTLLRKLESKIYKYAQVDFDRETSLFVIDIILGYLTTNEKATVLNGIDNFISSNEKKILDIFEENRSRYAEIPILTQPEVFLIWFCLSNFPFSITDNWSNDFDNYEIDEIRTLWGKEFD